MERVVSVVEIKGVEIGELKFRKKMGLEIEEK